MFECIRDRKKSYAMEISGIDHHILVLESFGLFIFEYGRSSYTAMETAQVDLLTSLLVRDHWFLQIYVQLLYTHSG